MFRQWLDKYFQSISEDEWVGIEEDDDAFDYAHCGPGISVDTMEGRLRGGTCTINSDAMHAHVHFLLIVPIYTLSDQPSS